MIKILYIISILLLVQCTSAQMSYTQLTIQDPSGAFWNNAVIIYTPLQPDVVGDYYSQTNLLLALFGIRPNVTEYLLPRYAVTDLHGVADVEMFKGIEYDVIIVTDRITEYKLYRFSDVYLVVAK